MLRAGRGSCIDPAAYEIETASGKLTLLGSLGGTAGDPIVVTYTGGYELPDEAPPALKAALQLMVQAALRSSCVGSIPACARFLTKMRA